MPARSSKSSTADEVAAIENLVTDLERRLRKLTELSHAARGEVSGAGENVKDFVNDALAGIMSRMRENTANLSRSAADKATRAGGTALKKFTDEIAQRPLTMLAIAVGIGFFAGVLNRR
jgi:ElaB/YqjD/DUF883 family membrane-anchored ribosome-binding protein